MSEIRTLHIPVSFEVISQGWAALGAIVHAMWQFEATEIEYVRHDFRFGLLETTFRVLS